MTAFLTTAFHGAKPLATNTKMVRVLIKRAQGSLATYLVAEAMTCKIGSGGYRLFPNHIRVMVRFRRRVVRRRGWNDGIKVVIHC